MVGRPVVAALLTVGVLGCGGGGATGPGVVTTPNPAVGLATGIAKAQADSARYPYTEADIRFMSGMISHHAQAIVMAQWAKSHGARPEVITLAGRVINAQRDEIALMSNWLRDRRQPVPDPSPTGMKMVMNGVEHEMLMPGMLTPEQMRQLDQARGAQFDELFLRFMIQHHNGAITMVKELFDSYGAAQDNMVFKFASDVNIDQTTEVARMEKMLFSIIVARTSN
jgi:uncharacterized protein (DUF305 family)